MAKTTTFNFQTSYNQFYICDKDSPMETDSDQFWTDEAYDDKLAIELGVIGVGTECYGPVKGELILLEKENTDFDPSLYDHIVEAGLKIDSGTIQIQNCPDSSVELELSVNPDLYRFRIYSSNLASVDGDEGDDFYRVEVWKDSSESKKVIKRYSLGQ